MYISIEIIYIFNAHVQVRLECELLANLNKGETRAFAILQYIKVYVSDNTPNIIKMFYNNGWII